MTTQSISAQFRFIPAKDLQVSPLNVRKTGTEVGIEQLAQLILAEGVLQNLNVHALKDDDRAPFGVVAGGRRLRALQQLIRAKKLKADHPVPCMIVTRDRAQQISLSENSGREPMHPADEFEAFRQLIDAGASIEDVAARFGVSPVVVQRRLKLANVAPSLIKAYREGSLTLDHLMAFALCEDHARQVETWEGLKPFERTAEHIRERLTQDEVLLTDPLARYVGLAAYQKAGGVVRRDLFSEDDEAYLDAELVRQLASAKLEKQAAKLRAEGLAWVEVHPNLEYAVRSQFGRVSTTRRAPTAEEEAAINDLESQIDALQEAQDEASNEEDAEREKAWCAACDQIDELREKLHVPDPEQQALAGAIVSVGRDGRIEIVRDLLKSEDAARFARAGRPRKADESASDTKGHSAALLRRLTAHRTLALQAELASQPSIALIALTHRMLLWNFYPYEFLEEPVKLQKPSLMVTQHEGDLEGSAAQQALKARRDAIQSTLPKQAGDLLSWLAARPSAEVQELLAYCVATTVDGVQADERESDLDPLARLAQLDMHRWWQPTAACYFGSIPKARILEIVSSVTSPDTAAPLVKLTKGLLAQEAEKILKDSGWLPEVLRTPS